MRFINKDRTIPLAFEETIQQVLITPNNIGYKSIGKLRPALLEFLIEEQNGLCAYCNQRINAKSATVEHFICQSHNPNLDLNYHNLFAVCDGNEGGKMDSHCDKYRANQRKNDYFFPFIFFEKCLTSGWNQINPFFDVEFNPRTLIISGKIIARETKVDGYPSIKPRIENAIDTLNLNAEILKNARKTKWVEVLKTKEQLNCDWEQLFNYYFTATALTDFHEFVLLAIRKQK